MVNPARGSAAASSAGLSSVYESLRALLNGSFRQVREGVRESVITIDPVSLEKVETDVGVNINISRQPVRVERAGNTLNIGSMNISGIGQAAIVNGRLNPDAYAIVVKASIVEGSCDAERLKQIKDTLKQLCERNNMEFEWVEQPDLR